jgi:predicted phosphodiesterase
MSPRYTANLKSRMKIRVLSDLHLEFSTWTPPAVDADVVVLAGDIHVGVDGMPWARAHFGDTPIIYVAGNHEFYGHELEAELHRLHRAARSHDIELLDGNQVVLGGVRFLGATLWTDFEFNGRQPDERARAMSIAQKILPDFEVIRFQNSGRLSPRDTRSIHCLHERWLRARLSEPYEGSTVVVTHHLPHGMSVHPKHQGSPLNPAFVTHLPHLVTSPVALWIHGHTHESLDYRVDGVRVVCNPRGYLPHEPNVNFDPTLVVELPYEGAPR